MSSPATPPKSNSSATRTGRRAVWLAVLVAIAWLAIGSVAGPLSGKLSEVQTNDNASFLPASAESTLVADEVSGFQDKQPFPALITVTRADGGVLDEAQLAAANAFAQEIPSIAVGDTTVAAYLSGPGAFATPSEDGKAVLIAVPLDADKSTARVDGELALGEVTTALRAQAAGVDGLVVNVTGPAGILADLIAVFGAIDTTLLGATALIVAIILIFVYRSPFLWLIPLVASGMALSVASAIVYYLAKSDVLVLNGQSQGILTVLVFGAGTDYALLMVARYREELHNHALHTDAMKAAWRGTVEPIVASAATVSIGLLCLLLSELNSNRSLGPVGAAGILGALVVMITFLPALLVVPSVVLPVLAFLVPTVIGLALSLVTDISVGPFAAAGGLLAAVTIVCWVVFGIMRIRNPHWGPFSRDKYPPGRWAFWPRVPHEGGADERMTGLWAKLAGNVGRRPRMTWVVTALAMLVLSGFALTLKAGGITTTEAFVERTDSVIGQEHLADHFAGGLGSPAIIVANEGSLDSVKAAAESSPGIASVAVYTGAPAGVPGADKLPPVVVDGRVQLQATLAAAADSPQAIDDVETLRANVHAVAGADALVGGQTASQLDVDQASVHDRNLIIPVVLVVIFVILMLLLRSIAAPVLLMATVVLSFTATLGVCALAFNHLFGFAGADTSFPLFAFVFLVALGVDYNIFLMTRVREESKRIGTRPGILRGLTVTGGVITSAGIVLAATFLVLGVLPLVFLREIGFAVAIGVLLDTFVIRSTLVPALAYDLGQRIWWPSKLARQSEPLPESVPATDA